MPLFSFIRLCAIDWKLCRHSNLETKMCPCIGFGHHRSTQSNAFGRISVHIVNYIHLEADTNSSTHWNCGCFFLFKY